jgi:hypothetical protein
MIRATAIISTAIRPRWASAERPVLRAAVKPTDAAELVEGSDEVRYLPDSEGIVIGEQPLSGLWAREPCRASG